MLDSYLHVLLMTNKENDVKEKMNKSLLPHCVSYFIMRPRLIPLVTVFYILR